MIIFTLIQINVGNINIFKNLFPITIFEKVQNNPEPINLINEWDEFLIFFLCVKYKGVSQNTSESNINYIKNIKIVFLQKDYIQKEIIYNRSDYNFNLHKI